MSLQNPPVIKARCTKPDGLLAGKTVELVNIGQGVYAVVRFEKNGQMEGVGKLALFLQDGSFEIIP